MCRSVFQIQLGFFIGGANLVMNIRQGQGASAGGLDELMALQ